MKSAAVAIVMITILSLTSGCTAPDSSKAVYIRIETDKEKYASGENINAALFLVNMQDREFQFNFSSGHQWDLTLYGSDGREVYDVAKHMMYIQVFTSIRVRANSKEQIGYFTWDQKDNDGAAVKSGGYVMKAKLAGYPEINGEKNMTIDAGR